MAAGMLFALSAAQARVASPTSSPVLPPKVEALAMVSCDVAHPARIEASAINETADPIRSGFDIGLPLAFGLCGHGFEFRHGSQQVVERVGHDLLCGAPIDRAGEPKLEVALRIEPESECGLRLSAWRGTRSRHGTGTRRG